MNTLSSLRAWLYSQPDLSTLSEQERFAVLTSARIALDARITERGETERWLAQHAKDGVVTVNISYRNSGWGYDDAFRRTTTVKATRKAWDAFVGDLRSDCDSCDASISVV